jgi:alpha-galactosidase
LTAIAVHAAAEGIPLQLPRPDGKPGDATRPVKVYILAGQSNMVGMGDITGARPPWPSVLLSADPAIIPGMMPIGGSALAAHGVCQTADPKAEKGAVVALYAGAYDPKADYSKRTPARTATVALGTVSATLPSMDGPCTPVVTAFIDVPATGSYTLHAGFGDSTYAIVVLDGKEVYRKEVGGKPAITKVALETGKRYPVAITYFKGGSAAFWLEQVDIEGKGDLKTLTQKDGEFPYLLDDAGKWTVRGDASYTDPRLFPQRAASPLSPTSNNGKSTGPELGFGCVMGTFHDEQVLLIKTAQGNRSLGFDFRLPSSGKTDRAGADQWEGLEYRLMIEGVHKSLDQIDKLVPGYQGQGYEIAGFGWFQGHKDSGSTKEEYEKHLVNLINDLRKEFKAPKMPAVVATVGFNGYRIVEGPWKGVWEAQMAVGDPKQHPDFAGTVASVDTRDFWRERDESPAAQGYHYSRNSETYLLVGEAMGRAMVRMQGGKAEAITKSDREARVAAETVAQAAKPVPTAEHEAASLAALKAMILDGALAAFVNSPRYQPELKAAFEELTRIYHAENAHSMPIKPPQIR